MDKRSVRVARELADQGIDSRRGISLFVFIAALLVALAIGLVRTAPSFASPRVASRVQRDPAVRKHDEQGDESDVVVLRDDAGGGANGKAAGSAKPKHHQHHAKHNKHNNKHHGNQKQGNGGAASRVPR